MCRGNQEKLLFFLEFFKLKFIFCRFETHDREKHPKARNSFRRNFGSVFSRAHSSRCETHFRIESDILNPYCKPTMTRSDFFEQFFKGNTS